MPNRDDTPAPSPGLDLRIEELATLLDEARARPAPDNADIPVLDEEVAAPAVPPGPDLPPAAPGARLPPRQLVELGQRLQQRVDAELDDLADVIRTVVKRCILEELRKELPPAAGSGTPNPHKPDAA